ncbi:hypothetical protein MKW98_013177 [Papaver atlanticum]|uniref:Uncharacterized protein n=1 Tax=Papaver atlanticum TaxID=357466 RepID=A0AAD4T5Z7_9MAGN|nr:hypothetical protein MKW98_013177 [Papaver atlanticum]
MMQGASIEQKQKFQDNSYMVDKCMNKVHCTAFRAGGERRGKSDGGGGGGRKGGWIEVTVVVVAGVHVKLLLPVPFKHLTTNVLFSMDNFSSTGVFWIQRVAKTTVILCTAH